MIKHEQILKLLLTELTKNQGGMLLSTFQSNFKIMIKV